MDSLNKFKILIFSFVLFSCGQAENQEPGIIRIQVWGVESKNEACMTLSHNVGHRIAPFFFSETEGCLSKKGWVLCPYISHATVQLNRDHTFILTEIYNTSSFQMELPDTLNWHVSEGIIQLGHLNFLQMPSASILEDWD